MAVGIRFDDREELRAAALAEKRLYVSSEPVKIDLSPDSQALGEGGFAGREAGRLGRFQGTRAQSLGRR
jgi:hypothetical protein